MNDDTIARNKLKKYGFKIINKCGSGSYGNIYGCDVEDGAILSHGIASKGCLMVNNPIEQLPLAAKVFKGGLDQYSYMDKGIGSHAIVELGLLMKCNHPNIIKLRYIIHTILRNDRSAEVEFHPFTVGIMDRAELNLEQYDTLLLKPIRKRELMRDVASALTYLHSLKFAHLDIKPANILINIIDSKPRALLCDFNMSKSITKPQKATQEYMTHAYRSPELIMGEPFDLSADIWALGVLFHEIEIKYRPISYLCRDYIIRHITKVMDMLISNNEDENKFYWGQLHSPWTPKWGEIPPTQSAPPLRSLSKEFSITPLSGIEDPQLKLLLSGMLNLNPNSRLKAPDILDSLNSIIGKSINKSNTNEIHRDCSIIDRYTEERLWSLMTYRPEFLCIPHIDEIMSHGLSIYKKYTHDTYVTNELTLFVCIWISSKTYHPSYPYLNELFNSELNEKNIASRIKIVSLEFDILQELNFNIF